MGLPSFNPPPLQEGPEGKGQFTPSWKMWLNQLVQAVRALLGGNITAGTNVTVTGTWPNQTVNAIGGGTGGGVTSVSVVANNGITQAVADATTAPVITLGLGAITPTSVAASGSISAGTPIAAASGGTGLATGGTAGAVLVWAGSAWAAIFGVVFNRQTASYVLVLADGDNNHWVEMNVAGANTLTIPPHSSVAIPVNTTILWSQYGAGQITITPGLGVTLRKSSTLTSRAQYSTGGMTQVATDEWYVYGDLT